MRVGIVVPHIFMHRDILPKVIFSPGELALELASGLEQKGAKVTLFTPGPVGTTVTNVTADLSLFEQELSMRGDTYIDLLKKHPLTFISMARQAQAELIATAYAAANRGDLDIVHIYTNEEEIALPFAQFCKVPVVFTHHDPFNFSPRYRSIFPKYKHLNWLSMSLAQRRGMPDDTNWIANIYHGLPKNLYRPIAQPTNDYVAFLGRIINPKGAHLAIAAVRHYNAAHPHKPLTLKMAGKHYAGSKDLYWQEHIKPALDRGEAEYVGHIADSSAKQAFLANAQAVLAPSTFDEPFGMVLIESLACGTPVIGLKSGAIPEVIQPGKTGILVPKTDNEKSMITGLSNALTIVGSLDRRACRQAFEQSFTLEHMVNSHLKAYHKLTNS